MHRGTVRRETPVKVAGSLNCCRADNPRVHILSRSHKTFFAYTFGNALDPDFWSSGFPVSLAPGQGSLSSPLFSLHWRRKGGVKVAEQASSAIRIFLWRPDTRKKAATVSMEPTLGALVDSLLTHNNNKRPARADVRRPTGQSLKCTRKQFAEAAGARSSCPAGGSERHVTHLCAFPSPRLHYHLTFRKGTATTTHAVSSFLYSCPALPCSFAEGERRFAAIFLPPGGKKGAPV